MALKDGLKHSQRRVNINVFCDIDKLIYFYYQVIRKQTTSSIIRKAICVVICGYAKSDGEAWKGYLWIGK